MSRTVYQVRVAGARGPGLSAEDTAAFEALVDSAEAAAVTAAGLVAPFAAVNRVQADGYVTDKMVEAAGTVAPSRFRSVVWVSGATYVATAIAKKGERKRLGLFCNGGAVFDARFDLEFGIAYGAGATITDLGNGWYLCQVTVIAGASTSANFQIRIYPVGGTASYTGDGTSGLYVDYISLLKNGVEQLASTDIAGSGWTNTSVSLTAPAITQEAGAVLQSRLSDRVFGKAILAKLTEDSGSVTPICYRSFTWQNGTAYVLQIKAKKGARHRLNLYCNGGAVFDCTFDLEIGTATGTGATITDLGNDEYLCEVAKTASATTSGNLQLRVYPSSGGQPYVGDGASGLYVGPAMLTAAGVNQFDSNGDYASAAWTKLNLTATANAGTSGGLDTASNASAHPLAGMKVAMVGTSLIDQGYLTTAFATATGATVQKLGYSGGALGLDARGSPHYGSGQVTALLPSIAADTNVIILDGLPNDVAASDVPLGAIGDTTTATFYGALASFFTYCETNFPNAPVVKIITSPGSSAISPSDYTQGHVNANGNTLEDFQNAERRACLYHGRPYIDPNGFGVGFHDAGENTVDGLHWDTSGAAKVAAIVAKGTEDLCDAGWLLP